MSATLNADTVLVTVAPGACVTVSPHPSGLPLAPLALHGGDTLRVSPEEGVDD